MSANVDCPKISVTFDVGGGIVFSSVRSPPCEDQSGNNVLLRPNAYLAPQHTLCHEQNKEYYCCNIIKAQTDSSDFPKHHLLY